MLKGKYLVEIVELSHSFSALCFSFRFAAQISCLMSLLTCHIRLLSKKLGDAYSRCRGRRLSFTTVIKRGNCHTPQCKKRSTGKTASHIRRGLAAKGCTPLCKSIDFTIKATLTSVSKSGGHAVSVVRVIVVVITVVVHNAEIVTVPGIGRAQPPPTTKNSACNLYLESEFCIAC